MGKSKYDKLDYFGKREADAKMAKQYGIDTSQYGNQGRPGAGGVRKKSYDQLKKDIARAASNDYDLRRSIEAAKLSGNKKAQKIGKGISNASEAYAAHRFMEKTHKKRMGNSGQYSSANDKAGVTDYWVNKDRNKFTDSIADQFDDKQTSTTITPADKDEPYKPSDQLLKHRGIVADWEAGYGPGGSLSPYKSDFKELAFDSEQNKNPYQATTDVNEFVSNYKKGLKNSFDFRPVIA